MTSIRTARFLGLCDLLLDTFWDDRRDDCFDCRCR